MVVKQKVHQAATVWPRSGTTESGSFGAGGKYFAWRKRLIATRPSYVRRLMWGFRIRSRNSISTFANIFHIDLTLKSIHLGVISLE